MTAVMLFTRRHSSSGLLISDQTILNRLREVGLRFRRPLRGPSIAPYNRRTRLRCAREHTNWEEEDWRYVCFSDESRFGMRPDKRRTRVWRTFGRKERLRYCQEVHPYKVGEQ